MRVVLVICFNGNIGLEVADAVIDKEPGGRPSGEAFVRLASKEHAELALERSKNYMGSRYGTSLCWGDSISFLIRAGKICCCW